MLIEIKMFYEIFINIQITFQKEFALKLDWFLAHSRLYKKISSNSSLNELDYLLPAQTTDMNYYYPKCPLHNKIATAHSFHKIFTHT